MRLFQLAEHRVAHETGGRVGGQRVAVVRFRPDFLGADGARTARGVDHHHALAETLLHHAGDHAPHRVRGPARRPGDDHRDRARGVPFLLCRDVRVHRDEAKRQQAGYRQEICSPHALLPVEIELRHSKWQDLQCQACVLRSLDAIPGKRRIASMHTCTGAVEYEEACQDAFEKLKQ